MSEAAGRVPSLRRIARHRASLAVVAVVATLLAPALVYVAGPAAAAPPSGFTTTGHPNPAADVSACSTRAAATLCVRAAEDSILPGAHLGGQGPSKNDPVPAFKWLINQDNTGSVTLGADGKTPIASEVTKCHPITSTNPNGNPNYPNGPDGKPILPDGSPNPAACNWPSIHNITTSPVVSEGTQVDWNPTTAIPLFANRGLKDGKYLVSVTSNGFQIGGGHFTVTGGKFGGLDATTSGAVVVSLNPLPIPLTNIRLKVYGDMASTNAQWDEQSEFGLAGLQREAGRLRRPGQRRLLQQPVVHGLPAHAVLQRDTPRPHRLLLQGQARTGRAPDHRLRPPHPRQLRGGWSGHRSVHQRHQRRHPHPEHGAKPLFLVGHRRRERRKRPHQRATIAPQKTCDVLGTTSDAKAVATQDQACWVQTTTLEGNHDFDTWPQANSTGYDTELLVGGELVPEVQFGFVRAGCMANPVTGTVDFRGLTGVNWLSPSDPKCATAPRAPHAPAATGGIKGRIMGAAAYYPGLGGLAGTGRKRRHRRVQVRPSGPSPVGHAV